MLAALGLAWLVGWPQLARADKATGIELLDKIGERDEEDTGLDVLQNRKYVLLHEISLLGGSLPVDPYFKGITGSVGYALHFSDFVAWEVAQFTYSYNIDSKIKREVVRVQRINARQEPDFPEITWILASHLVIKPIYGKEAVFNREVVHLEAYVQAGPAFVQRSLPETSFSVGADMGVGLRLWWTPNVSLRFDISELIYMAGAKPEAALHLHAGFGFNFRGEE